MKKILEKLKKFLDLFNLAIIKFKNGVKFKQFPLIIVRQNSRPLGRLDFLKVYFQFLFTLIVFAESTLQ